MADFFDPDSGTIYRSLHTPDGIKRGLIENPPGLDSVLDIPPYYRKWTGTVVWAATVSETAAIDAARLPAIKAARKAALADETQKRLALADSDYVAAAARVDAAATIAAVAAVSLAAISKT